MKKLRKVIIALLTLVFVGAISIFAISSATVSDDPADSYKVQVAPNEDSSINMWFDYSFRKTFTSDTASTGKNTFSIYMAKNEIEDGQFVLYSDTDHTGMSATLSTFIDSHGNTVEASIYYEMYVTTSNLNSESVYMSNESTTFIREGETPDPIAPLANVGTFKLNGGKSQAFLIRAKTTTDSVSGWYSAQLDILDSSKNIVKTATVYLYVWNFELSDETALETAFCISGSTDFGGNYKVFYDYMLENRMCGFDLPTGVISSTNSYLTKDRVVSVRLAATAYPGYLDRLNEYGYKNIYNNLASSSIWDDVKGKIYAYTADEPLPEPVVGTARDTVDTADAYSDLAILNWGDTLRTLVTPCEDHPYPYDNYYTKSLSQYSKGQISDAVQAMIDNDNIYIWCPRIYEFTPYSAIQGLTNRRWENYDQIRNASIYPYSGVYGDVGAFGIGYVDWEGHYGARTTDRYLSYITSKNNSGTESLDLELWTYSAGYNKSYTYCNHVIENTGIQTKMLFWQCYQEDVTGYLYYATNGWTEYTNSYDSTVTGAKTTCNWYLNQYTTGKGDTIWGNGVLFYGMSMGKIKGCNMIGSLRVELMRDGIEEYQMMYQLEQLKGEEVAKSYVNSVSNSVIDYVSMPAYDRSSWDSNMDEYDIMEAARRALGNALEAATEETICEHLWDDGVVTKDATCTNIGTLTYTCTKCGAKNNEYIPNIHQDGSTFVKVSGTAPTCTTNGEELYRCSLCGFEKTVRTASNHSNSDVWTCEYKNTSMHIYICNECGAEASDQAHYMYVKNVQPTCQDTGYSAMECKYCGYRTDETIIDIVDHNYVDGVCTMCGQLEHVVIYGDIDGNGKVNSADLNTLTKYITGTINIDQYAIEAADVSGDGKVNSADSNYMIKYISGSISIFPSED